VPSVHSKGGSSVPWREGQWIKDPCATEVGSYTELPQTLILQSDPLIRYAIASCRTPDIRVKGSASVMVSGIQLRISCTEGRK
jgi:hypothetical protein